MPDRFFISGEYTMRYFSYVNTAAYILETYEGNMPFASWLKDFFREHKKYGATDRKQIAHLCYCYYRMGKALVSMDKKQAIIIALFLCSQSPNEMLKQLDRDLNEKAKFSQVEKLSIIQEKHNNYWQSIFPYAQFLPGEIDHQLLSNSFLVQPDLFLRIRPGNEKRVKEQLQSVHIPFYELSGSAIGMPNGIKVEEVLKIDREVVVQDLNSQKTMDPLHSFINETKAPSVWDCCAASGGKSILLYDLKPDVKLLLSDLRNKIIYKLQERFERAGIKNYQFSVEDASTSSPMEKFDLVICDAPCTGSGTWSRTPEQLYFFNEEKIGYYSTLQKKIAINAGKAVRKNGCFLYITCSVFKNENEDVVEFIQENLPLKLSTMQYFKGYDRKADTLFAALFTA